MKLIRVEMFSEFKLLKISIQRAGFFFILERMNTKFRYYLIQTKSIIWTDEQQLSIEGILKQVVKLSLDSI